MFLNESQTFWLTNVFWEAVMLVALIMWFSADKSRTPISLDEATKAQYKAKIVIVKAGNNIGSGCKQEDGYYLTAFHVVLPAWLNKDPITVNGIPAKVLYHSRTERDIAILTTLENPDLSKATTPSYEFKEGEYFVLTGNPGNEIDRVQVGQITNVVRKDRETLSISTQAREIFAEYIREGISGGCVYPMGWEKPVGVSTLAANDKDRKRGSISLASKVTE
jgi:hypothetical protein